MAEAEVSASKGRGERPRRGRYRAPDDVRELVPTDFITNPSPTELMNAPGVLYAAGDVSLLDPGRRRVAIVGSRKASAEGVRRARKLASLLAREGVVVVSGLAKGIDQAAHLGAIGVEGGRTVAVIGTPFERAYPAEHGPLQERLWREHLVVSQFKAGSRVYPSNFVARNRTMALLVNASVIVEAGDSSGTLSQAAETQRLGRPLFLMRSVLERPGIQWPQRFMENGARVLDEVQQLLDVLP